MALAAGQMGIYTRKILILGIDPGRDKTGFAFVDFNGNLLASGIFETSKRDDFFADLKNFQDSNLIIDLIIEGSADSLKDSQIKFLALGNGTHSKKFYSYLSGKLPDDINILLVDEENTTLEARALYWKLHKPGLLMRLIPEGLRVPDRVLDDLAACIIALRALKKYKNIEI